MCSPFLTQQILKAVDTLPAKIQILKSGEGKNTRYDVELIETLEPTTQEEEVN